MCSGFEHHNRHSEVVIEDHSLLLTTNPIPQSVTCQPPQFLSLQSSYNALVCGICMVPFPCVLICDLEYAMSAFEFVRFV